MASMAAMVATALKTVMEVIARKFVMSILHPTESHKPICWSELAWAEIATNSGTFVNDFAGAWK